MTQSAVLQFSQQGRYGDFYTHARRVFSRLRFDVNYRRRRLHEVLGDLRIQTAAQHVLDVGFGAGDLLLSFPHSCRVVGVDVSSSAVAAAQQDPRFAAFAGARFALVPEHAPEAMPELEVDLVLSSHVLEHAPDDRVLLAAIRSRLRPGGVLALFVPLEEPDYILFHRRNYSLQSVSERVEQAGFELLHAEGNLFVNGHVWKCLTVPSRRNWPGVRHLVDALRMGTLGAMPYGWLRRADRLLFLLGASARQALIIARRPEAPPS